jgi:CRISPR-associated protein Cas1
MAWRGVHLSKAAHLRLEHRNLVIEFREEPKSVARLPIEDIAYLILDSLEITLSASLLAAMSENEIMVLGINDRHLPAWSSFPWGLHYRQGEVTTLQLECSVPLKKRIWQHIVERKILAQAWSLQAHGLRFSDTLKSLASTVLSGDTNNVEARAAVIYWGEFFAPRDFRRHAEDLPNILLNYGYSLIRAGLARHLCAAGFLPILGVHHCSMNNAFNLADDLIEPYRPFVDYFAKIILADREDDEDFCTDDRRALTQILESPVLLEGNEMTLFSSIKLVTQSLKQAIRQREPALLVFPQLKI